MDIVDTHAHIYAPDERRYPPIEKPLRPPAGKGSLEDLRRESEANGVAAACIIQTSSFYRFDNRYILDSAKAAPEWTAGVVTLDPDNPDSGAQLARYARDFGVKGLRSNPASDGRIDHPGVRALWRAAADLGIVINLHIQRELAAQAEKLLEEFSSAPVVLDHSLYPKVGPELDDILAAVSRLARHANLHAKLSFVATGSRGGHPCADMHNACLQIIHWFGPERCVWGSDFPCGLWTPRVSYAEALDIFENLLPLSESARQQILGQTARKLWFNG
jgi:predicted TIM-barrel fold metal-dependent hydrolase